VDDVEQKLGFSSHSFTGVPEHALDVTLLTKSMR
jgi:hypothetical protein